MIGKFITNIFTASFWRQETFWHGIVVAVLLGILTRIGLWIWGLIRDGWRSRHDYDIPGFWIGLCQLPSYGPIATLEIWHYKKKRDQITLTFFSYAPDSKPSKWVGAGVHRGPKLSAFYYRLDNGSFESGVIALELKSARLKGIYAQFDPKIETDPLYVSATNPPDYVQRRIKLPRVAMWRMHLGLAPYSSYQEVKALYDALPK